MKTNRLILAGLAFAAALTSSFAQSTVAVTDPVGYVTVQVAPGAGSETFIGAPLVNKIEVSGAVTAKAASSITLGSGIAASQFDGLYYVEITSGTNAGVWTDITATPSANTITTADNLASMITVGDTIAIRKHHTVESFLGDANVAGDENKAGLLSGAQVTEADNVVLFDATNQSPLVFFFSTDEFDGGWRTPAGASVANTIIAPGQGLKVIRKGSGTVNEVKFTQVGHVKTGPTVLAVEPGENFISIPLATGVTLNGSTLGAVITSGPQISQADNVVINVGDNQFKSVFFSTDEFDGGWRDAGAADFGAQSIIEGKSVNIINTVNPTAFNLKFPAQVINP